MTTPTPTERFLAWRQEIAIELEQATEALPPLEAAHAAESAAVQAAHDVYGALQRLIGPIVPHPEAPLAIRIHDHRATLDQAKSRHARALTDLEVARARVSSLQRALAQIDRIVPPADEEAA